MFNSLLVLLFLHIKMTLGDGGSAELEDEASDSGVNEGVFASVVVAAFIGGVITGSIALAVVGCCVWKWFGGSDRVQFREETDLNESKRYLPSNDDINSMLSISSTPTAHRLTRHESLKVPHTPLAPKASHSDIPIKQHTASISSSAIGKRDSSIKPLKPTKPKLRRSISLGDESLATVRHLPPPDDEEVYVNDEFEGSFTDTEHYYACDSQTKTPPLSTTTPAAVGVGNRTATISVSQLHSKTKGKFRDVGPQYYNVGFKLKGEKSNISDKAKSTTTLPSGISLFSESSEYVNIKTK